MVASVQGSVISRDALAHWTKIKRAEQRGSPSSAAPSNSTEVRDRALAFLITAAWLEKEAAAEGIIVSSSEVEATYQELLNGLAGPALAGSLKRRGMSSADELLQLRLEKLALKLRFKIVAAYQSVPMADIAAYYRTHAGQFRQRGQTLPGATPAIRQTLLQTRRQRQIGVFNVAFRQRWKQRTTCQPGYVIAECRNGPPLSASPAN